MLAKLTVHEGHSTDERMFPTTTFLESRLSTIGLGEQGAIAAGNDIEVRRGLIKDMPIVPRPKIVEETAGMANFIVDKQTGLILGVSAADLGGGIYTHPSTSEVFNQVLG